MGNSTQVLICGAGAAGLTLAIELARRGVDFKLIDQLPAPFHGSRGKGIQPRTQEIFEDLGVLDRAVALGGLYPPVRKYQPDGSSTVTDVMTLSHAPTPAEPYQLPLMVPQFLTEQVLRERLCELGVVPEFGVALVAFEQRGGTIEATLQRGSTQSTVQARYLIGADGGKSFVRKTLGVAFPGKTLGVRALVADVVLNGLDAEHWHQFGGRDPSEALAICPLKGTTLFQLQGPIPLEGEVDLTAAALTAMVRARTGMANLEVQEVSWASAYNMNARLADHYRQGNAFLVGDAAHIHPPTGGQGLNTSVQDAYNLGWKLAAVLNGAPDALLDSYEEERRPIASDMLGLSTQLLEGYKHGDNRRGREVQQLDLGYRNSQLALHAGHRAQGPLAGDRAPDALIKRASGQGVRVFELLAGTHWTAFGFHADRSALAPRAGLHIHHFGACGDLVDATQHFSSHYQLSPGDWVLIRPDGYLAALVSSQDIQALDRYLDGCGVCA